jgi:hypothetical protein
MSNTIKVVDTESSEKEATAYMSLHNNPFSEELLKHDPCVWKRIRIVRGKMTPSTPSEIKL